MKYLLPLISAVLLSGAATAEPLRITEWEVPWPNTRPRDPYVAPDGQIWFVGQAGDYAARFAPESEAFTRFDLPPGTGPHNQIVANDGKVWIAGNKQGYIGRLDPADGSIHQVIMPKPAAKDPHTLVFDGRGHIWFTVQWGNFVGRLNMNTEAVDLLAVPSARARPYGILTTPAGRPWVVLLGTNKLLTIDPESLELTEVALPRRAARPRRIGQTSDGRIWYVDYEQGYLGSYQPDSGRFQEWRMPGADKSGPYAMAVDAQDRIWVVETWQHPNRLVGFDPASEKFFSLTEIPSGGGAVRHMVYDPGRNAVWFGTDTNTLGRAELP